MNRKIFIIDLGSASKKYALYAGEERLFFAHYEREGDGFIVGEKNISVEEYDAASVTLLKEFPDITAIGLRVVAPGKYFAEHRRVDDEFLAKLAEAEKIAPLHLGLVQMEIEKIRSAYPHLPLLALSDSAFVSAKPDYARYYGLPLETAQELDIERFGYHGLSFESILGQLEKMPDQKIGKRGKVIICHLGGGGSVGAFQNGKVVDTSMGFSPLEGLLMATRVGDIDAGALLYAQERLNLSPAALRDYLNQKCGLLGLSGRSDDIRELLKLESEGNERAKLALETFIYRIKKYIGAYFAVLGGLPAGQAGASLLVFTGTIGERSEIIRARVLDGLEPLGLKSLVIPSDELGQMARNSYQLLTAS